MARAALLTALAAMALVALAATQDARPVLDVADAAIARDRAERAAARAAGRSLPTARPPGFFGTIKQIVVDSVNDTKSAYQQISGLVNNQFSDTATAPPPPPLGSNTSTTEAPPRVSRAEFLRILDRNIKGLRRLYNLEVSEALKDSRANIRLYKLQASKNKIRR